jgi:NAD(P)-dependent dehydrogenase (short-subunit alcohol dehydrogenase family)
MVDSIGGPAALQQMIDQCPVKRCGQPEDIANLALFLASDDLHSLTVKSSKQTADSKFKHYISEVGFFIQLLNYILS